MKTQLQHWQPQRSYYDPGASPQPRRHAYPAFRPHPRKRPRTALDHARIQRAWERGERRRRRPQGWKP